MDEYDLQYEFIESLRGSTVIFEPRRSLAPVPHLHKEVEIVYIKEGSCTSYVNQKHYAMKAGDLFIAYPNQVHYYLDVPNGEYWLLIFNTNFLLEMEPEIQENELVSNVLHLAADSPLVRMIQQTITTDGVYARTRACYSIGLLMSELLPQLSVKPIIHAASASVTSVLDYCQNHYMEDISLDILSKKLHLNKNYISHIINKKTNMSLTFFINSLRIHAANKMLRNTDKKIFEIAQEVGFSSLRSFNRAFVEISQLTPTEYRKKFKA